MKYNPWPLGKIPSHLQRVELANLPKLGYKFNDPREIIDIFGVKKISKVSYFQSWCKACRNNQKNKTENKVNYIQRTIDI